MNDGEKLLYAILKLELTSDWGYPERDKLCAIIRKIVEDQYGVKAEARKLQVPYVK